MILAIANSKGGVGKTTIAVHLCNWLKLHGCSVVLVDCDAQRLSSKWMKVACPDIDVVIQDSAVDITLELPKLAKKYDAVIVDAPGDLKDTTVSILNIADATIIPTSGSQLDVSGLGWTIKTIHEIQASRKGLPVTAVLPVKSDARLKNTRNLKAKAKRLGFGVTKTALAYRQIYSQVAGLESVDGNSWEIPPSILWELGRNQTVRVAALEMDSAFKEIFPEVCEDNPNLIIKRVTPNCTF